jgi:hypothetical protein
MPSLRTASPQMEVDLSVRQLPKKDRYSSRRGRPKMTNHCKTCLTVIPARGCRARNPDSFPAVPKIDDLRQEEAVAHRRRHSEDHCSALVREIVRLCQHAGPWRSSKVATGPLEISNRPRRETAGDPAPSLIVQRRGTRHYPAGG